MEVRFRTMIKSDWEQVANIFKQGIETGASTFETEIPTWEEWDEAHVKTCRIVATKDDVVIAWAALIPVSTRKVYSGVGEVSIYIENSYKGQKIGTRLIKQLIDESEEVGFWILQAGIFPENTISIKLHESNGFRIVGYREKIGKMKDTWRNTILLERRSKLIGT